MNARHRLERLSAPKEKLSQPSPSVVLYLYWDALFLVTILPKEEVPRRPSESVQHGRRSAAGRRAYPMPIPLGDAPPSGPLGLYADEFELTQPTSNHIPGRFSLEILPTSDVLHVLRDLAAAHATNQH